MVLVPQSKRSPSACPRREELVWSYLHRSEVRSERSVRPDAISRRAALAGAKSHRGNAPVLPKVRSNAKVAGQHRRRRYQGRPSGRRLNALRDRARPPQRKPPGRESGAVKVVSDSIVARDVDFGGLPSIEHIRNFFMPKEKKLQPPQHQQQRPGREHKMRPRPKAQDEKHRGNEKLRDKVALITGGDSGIGRAIAIAFAKEGADVTVVYLEEKRDANETKRLVEEHGRRCLLISGNVGQEEFCRKAIAKTIQEFGRIDILVNNAAEQHPQESIEKITEKQLERTFRTNIFSFFFMTKAALKHLKKGAVIINTTSVTAYKGSAHLLDYSSTKGAITSFTRSLSQALAEKGVRVNGVAPGPIWTPLIPSTFPSKEVETFGSDVPLGRPGQPEEVAPSYVFLASDDSSYMTGQILHPNGGTVVNG
jgi:NAD(P)-dependent dehydrogenase (short-subunit alcohol dehydrogenase family)